MIGLLLAVLVAAVVVVAWGYGSSSIILKLDREPITVHPGSFGLAYEDFKARTPDGLLLDGWFVPAAKPARSAIIVLHGWGSNRSDVLPMSAFLQKEHHLVYFDFRN